MRYLKEYSSFLNEEWSRNEPIPEIIDKPKGLAIFLIGAPGIGKSYFVKKFIHPKNPSIKDFSTDDVSLLFTKDPNEYYKGRETPEGGMTSNAGQLNRKRIQQFIETGNSFIYDTTGAGKEGTDKGYKHIKKMFDLARENRYEIVFIHLLSTLQTSIDQDKLRDRHVDPKYIKWAYAKQMGGMIDGERVEGNMPRYKALGPDEYYVVLSIDQKYTFMKFINGKLARKKGDRYVQMNESATEESFGAYEVIQCIQEMIDDGYVIRIIDSKNSAAYPKDIYDDTESAQKLKIEVEHATLIRTHFKIEILVDTFEKLNNVFTEMYLANERLKDEGFTLVDILLDKQDQNEPNEIKFRRITYVFEKPDRKLEAKKSLKESISKEYLKDVFKKHYIYIDGLSYDDESISVEYDHPVDDFTGNYREIDRDLHSICVEIGATSYEEIGRGDAEFYFY